MFVEISVIIFWVLIIAIIILIVLIITGKINIKEEFNIETNVPITWVSTTFTSQSVNGTYSYQLIGDQVTLRLNSISSENKGTANGLITSSQPLPSHLIPNVNIYGPVIPVLSNGNVTSGSYIIYSNGTISFGLGWTNNSTTSTDFSLVGFPQGDGGSNNGISNTTITYLLK